MKQGKVERNYYYSPYPNSYLELNMIFSHHPTPSTTTNNGNSTLVCSQSDSTSFLETLSQNCTLCKSAYTRNYTFLRHHCSMKIFAFYNVLLLTFMQGHYPISGTNLEIFLFQIFSISSLFRTTHSPEARSILRKMRYPNLPETKDTFINIFNVGDTTFLQSSLYQQSCELVTRVFLKGV